MLLAPGNLDPGRLDRRVTLSYPEESRDGMGGVIVVWIEAATVWAEKIPAAGGRLYAAEAKRFERTLTYRIRHRAAVRPGWRLTHGAEAFEITALAEQGRGHWLDLELRIFEQPAAAVTVEAELLHDGFALLLHDGASQLLHAA